jgi:hypothetical protein
MPLPFKREREILMALTWKEAAVEALRGFGSLAAAKCPFYEAATLSSWR